jgi:S-methylmethionine-dependent homocysteine/selenocysteine methylase
MSYDTIARKLASGENIILDGGTGTDIQRRGVPMHGDTWCADANGTHLDVVREVHESYIASGADIITANTFATSALSFNAYGRDDDVVRLDALAVSAARQAAEGKDVAVAGSMSTMRPVYAGTDRTNLDIGWSEGDAKKLFRRKANNLKACGVDMIMMEMMRDSDYSQWATEAALETGLPVWIGIAAERRDDGVLVGFGRQDQPLDAFIPRLAALKPQVMCVMHTSPEDTGAAVEILKKCWSGPIGVYPESGYFKAPDWVFTEIMPDDLVVAAKAWQQQGVSIYGGCCGIGPAHIAALSEAFAA